MKNGWITYASGNKYHYVNDIIHNDNGPAKIGWIGSKYWYKHGKLHREDGPAIEWYGSTYWYYEGKKIKCSSNEEFLQLIIYKAFW